AIAGSGVAAVPLPRGQTGPPPAPPAPAWSPPPSLLPPQPAQPLAGLPVADDGDAPVHSGRSVIAGARPASHVEPAEEPRDAPPSMHERLPALRPLGQVEATYIVAEAPDGLYLVDQHA